MALDIGANRQLLTLFIKSEKKNQNIWGIKMNISLFKLIATQKVQFLRNLPNPNLMIASIGDRQVTLENIATDPHVSSCVQSRKSGVLSQTWEIQPSPKSPPLANDFVSFAFQQNDTFNIISEILNAPLFGFVVAEIIWRPVTFDTKVLIMPAKIQTKPNQWFYFDANNLLRYRNPDTRKDEILLPYKFLLVQNEATFNNPYGNAILSRCLWPVVFKKTFVTFWTNFAEKFGMPHFIGKTDSIASSEDFQKFQDLLDNLIQDGSAVISTQDTIEILNATTANSASIFQDFINFCNAEISKAILSQTLTTEIGNVGSYAAANVHATVREDIVKADKMLVEKAMNTVIRWIVDLNFGKQQEYPKFIIYREEDVDKPLAETVEILKRAGIQVLEPFVVRRMGLQKNEFKLESEQQSSAQNLLGFAEATIPPDQAIIDNEVDNLVDEPNGLDEIIDQVKNFLLNYDSFEEALNKIYDLFPKIKETTLANELTKRLFAAYLLGRYSVAQIEVQK
jgi:phage gp29-like protein